MLRIRLLGEYTIESTEGTLTPLSSKAARALFLLLLLAEGKPLERLSLAAKIWPDADDSLGLFYLRRTLSELRRSVGDLVLTPTKSTLALLISPKKEEEKIISAFISRQKTKHVGLSKIEVSKVKSKKRVTA